ncbi:hypothetical protein CFOL_v3_11344, partial [Cephalotus follicularis]
VLTLGTITMKITISLVRLYEQISGAKYVIIMRTCGTNKLIIVNVYLSGCPSNPKTIIDSIIKLLKESFSTNLSILVSKIHGFFFLKFLVSLI